MESKRVKGADTAARYVIKDGVPVAVDPEAKVKPVKKEKKDA